jgi:hypothetical protein
LIAGNLLVVPTMENYPKELPLITLERLQSLFKDKARRILRRHNRPTDNDLITLKENIVGLQLFARGSAHWAADNKVKRETLAAIRILLPRVAVSYKYSKSIAEQVKQEQLQIICEKERDMFCRLLSDLTQLRDSPRMKPSRQFESWRDFADPIAEYFVGAMVGANPGIRFGISNDGPLVRFVAALMPMIAGETVNEARVAQYLKRSRSRSRDISVARE